MVTGVIYQAWIPLGHVLFLLVLDDSCTDKGRVALTTSGSEQKHETGWLFLRKAES